MAFIVFEGGDCCGKTTQSIKLVEALKAKNVAVEFFHFPDRTTLIGRLIDEYLKKKHDMDDHAIHLLFSANRWEAAEKIKHALAAGAVVVVDRYSYSGIAYSVAKNKPGLSLDWCKQPEIGLPEPDLVVFLKLPPHAAATRLSFGSERYDKIDFQRKVIDNLDKLRGSNWVDFDASRGVEELHRAIKTEISKLNIKNL